MARRKGRRRPTRSRGRNATTRRGLTGPAAQPSGRFLRRGKARVAHHAYTASGGLELGGTATVAYRPAAVPGVGVFFPPVYRRLPGRRYHYAATGGLVLSGAASVGYRPAKARRYAHAASGGLLLGGAATVRYRPAKVARVDWDAELFLLDDALADVGGDAADELGLLILEEGIDVDLKKTVVRDGEGRIMEIRTREFDVVDRICDHVRADIRAGALDGEGRYVLDVPAGVDAALLPQLAAAVAARLSEGDPGTRPKILTWRTETAATAPAQVSMRRALGRIGFNASAR